MSPEAELYYFDVRLNIAPDEWLVLYRGEVDAIIATADNGKRVRFPANVMQPYVLHQGLIGHFRLFFNEQMRYVEVQRLA